MNRRDRFTFICIPYFLVTISFITINILLYNWLATEQSIIEILDKKEVLILFFSASIILHFTLKRRLKIFDDGDPRSIGLFVAIALNTVVLCLIVLLKEFNEIGIVTRGTIIFSIKIYLIGSIVFCSFAVFGKSVDEQIKY